MAKDYTDHYFDTLMEASRNGVDITKLSEEEKLLIALAASERQQQYQNRSTVKKAVDAANTAYGWFEIAIAVLIIVGVIIGVGYNIVMAIGG